MKGFALIAAILAASIAGCASAPQDTQTSAYDFDKVAQINTRAKVRGIEVQWLNYPRKKPAVADVTPSLGEPSGT